MKDLQRKAYEQIFVPNLNKALVEMEAYLHDLSYGDEAQRREDGTSASFDVRRFLQVHVTNVIDAADQFNASRLMMMVEAEENKREQDGSN